MDANAEVVLMELDPWDELDEDEREFLRWYFK